VPDVATKNWKILAYLKNAIEESKVEIAKPKTKEELINDVLKLRDLKRTELTLLHILDKDEQ
jgi:hypothetical protein